MKESTLLPIFLYKAEVVFVRGRLTLFPHRLRKITLMSGNKAEVGSSIAYKNSGHGEEPFCLDQPTPMKISSRGCIRVPHFSPKAKTKVKNVLQCLPAHAIEWPSERQQSTNKSA